MNLAKYIDYTLLKATATPADIEKLCQEARQYGFFSVCVNSSYVPLAAQLLKGTDVKVCTVVGFPLGAMSTQGKLYETSTTLAEGADEIDMVINVGALKDRDYSVVLEDIKAVKEACEDKTLKVIIETCLLTDEEIVKVSELCVKAGAEFVKTSTGFSTSGANEHVVALMKKTVGDKAKVKASGGIRDKATALKMIELGADRLGVSASVKIISE
mgnify:CR=1 FL=1